MVFRALLLFLFFTSMMGAASAQTAPASSTNPTDTVNADKDPRNTKAQPLGTPEQEMLARQDIKAAEKDYQENQERAREAAQLSAEIRDAFIHNKALGRIELKKLERLEKITRKIRSEAGGTDAETDLKNPPTQIEPALIRLAELSDKLRKGVEKTPRQVVSASVIDDANEMLDLLHLVTAFTR